jgi:hypothetical protein
MIQPAVDAQQVWHTNFNQAIAAPEILLVELCCGVSWLGTGFGRDGSGPKV